MAQTAQNDWLVAGLNNPDFTTQDFVNIADMSTENTQMLSKEEYMKSNFIQNHDAFKDEDGKFSERKFSDYYDARLRDFGEFERGEYLKGPALDMFDIFHDNTTPVQQVNFDIRRGVNPDRQAIGVEGVNVWSDPVFSRREIAKQNKVFDTETGEFRDYTVNEHTLVSNPVEWIKDQFRDPLVMAVWDEEGDHIDPLTGMKKHHQKGEEKLNEKGTYYYETLGKRSVLGKDVLSVFDTFTVDGQGINKYDFFDSNDIQKSVAGTVAKTVASVLPMFCGGPIGLIYNSAQIAAGMAQTLPMIYGMVTAFSDSETPQWMNTLAATGGRWSKSTSDYAKSNTFAFENFGSLVADVACQWGQQKAIAQGFNGLRKSKNYIKEAEENARALFEAKRPNYVGNEAALMKVCTDKFMIPAQKAMEKSTQLGRDMSLLYMALISNTDVYQDMLEHGASKAEAAAVTLGSTIGMFSVDKYLHLGEVFFDEATPDVVKQSRQALRNEFAQAREAMFNASKNADIPPRNKLLGLIKKAVDVSKKTTSQFAEDLKYHSLNAVGKMVGEGLEEVSEELVTDVSKSLYELAGQFGFDTHAKDVGAWDNAFDRYVMNFLGGAIGGGVFYGKEVWDGNSFHKPKLDQDIATLIRNGHVDELRKQLDVMHGEGKTGNKRLSARPDLDDKNEAIYRTINGDNDMSQADAVRNAVLDRINGVEEALLANRDANLSDDELFDNMVLSEARYQQYEPIAGLVNYYNNYAKYVDDYVQASKDLKLASTTIDGNTTGEPIATDMELRNLTAEQRNAREANLKALQDKVDASREGIKDFLSGNTSLDYVRKLNFAMDPVLHTPFLGVTKEEHFKEVYGNKRMDELTPDELMKFELIEWPSYVKSVLNTKLDEGYEKFKEFGKTIDPLLDDLSKGVADYRKWAARVPELFGENSALLKRDIFDRQLDWNQKLDSETDKEYEHRDTAMDNESEDDFQDRRWKRSREISQHNLNLQAQYAKDVIAELQKVNMEVDPVTARYIKSRLAPLGNRRALIDAITRIGTQNQTVRSKLSGLKVDLSNVAQISDEIRKETANLYDDMITKAITPLKDMSVTLTPEYEKDQNGTPIIENGRVKTKESETMSLYDFILVNQLGQDMDGVDLPALLDELRDCRDRKVELTERLRAAEEGGDPDDVLAMDDIINEIDELENGDPDNNVEPLTGALLSIDSLNELIDAVQNAIDAGLDNISKNDNGGNALSLADIVDDGFNVQSLQNTINERVDVDVAPLLNDVNQIVASIQQHPLFTLQRDLKTTLTNPVAELIKKMAQADGAEIADVEGILQTLQDNFDVMEDISELDVDSTQMDQLMKVRGYLRLLNSYLYAASTVPSSTNPIGHNKTINSFAESHADKLRTPWDKLPEIDADYVASCQQILNQYLDNINFWITLSDKNAMNRAQQHIRIDAAMNKALYGMLSKIDRKISINGKDYDLLDGIQTIDVSLLDGEQGKLSQVPLFRLEQLLHDNVVKAAADQGMTVSELVKSTNLMEKLIPGISNMHDQRVTPFTPSVSEADLTDFMKAQYIAAILSENPADFYRDLRDRVNQSTTIAPITIQEYASRIAQAALSQDFRDMMEDIRSRIPDQETPTLTNTVVVAGVAGAGKTQVVLNAIDSRIKGSPVFIAAPTMTQASAMGSVLSRTGAMTFNELLEKVVGADTLAKIRAEQNSIVKSNGTVSHSGTYMDVTVGSDGLVKVQVHLDQITFDIPADAAQYPKAIYLDEATHLSTVEAQLIDGYARAVGATVYMLGDMAQLGYDNRSNAIRNIDEGSIWAVRTPSLSVSLRDNNIQKANNQKWVRGLLEHILTSMLYDTEPEYHSLFADHVAKYLPCLNFKVYDGDQLAGDFISDTLSDAHIDKLKQEMANGKTVAFIGDQNSPQLQKMRSAGLVLPKENILSLETMQGQEFDYVVIDRDFTEPKNIDEARVLLQEIYTLMTRSRNASFFISPKLSTIIGGNVATEHTANAPSLAQGVQLLRDRKIDVLRAMDLDKYKPTKKATAPTGDPAKGNVPDSNGANPHSDFEDPDDQKKGDDDLDKAIKGLASDDQQLFDDQGILNLDDPDACRLQCYGDTQFTGAVVVDDNHTEIGKDGKQHKGALWRVSVPSAPDAELRNLQALVDPEPGKDSVDLFWYSDKIGAQQELSRVRSSLLFGHSWDEFSQLMKTHFPKTNWENGEFLLEMRAVADTDTLPVHSPYREVGMEYTLHKGTPQEQKVRLIANIVFRVKNANGQTCTFDLSGLNNPDTFEKNLETIKKNLQERIANPKTTSELREKLKKMLSTVDTTYNTYRTWFDGKVEEMQKTGTYTLNVGTAITNKQTTWLRPRPKNYPIRLGGKIDPNNITGSGDVHNLIDQNPDKVFSKVYTYANKSDLFTKIDPSLRGKAVIFVTADTMLKADQLANEYIQQKLHPDTHHPRVRMIVLDNYGMSFAQLCSPDFLQTIQQGKEQRKPFRQNFTGIRMFTSLWNTRAALINFNKALQDWKTAHNYTDAQVTTLIKAQDDLYQKKDRAGVLQSLKNAGLAEADLQNLDDFNNKDCRDIPMFRLGYTRKAGTPFHIQQFDIDKNSSAYDTPTANLCVVTAETADKYQKMLDAIIRPLATPHKGMVDASHSLGVGFSREVDEEQTDANGKKVRVKVNRAWEANEYIDPKDAAHRRSLSGLFVATDKGLTLTTDAGELTFSPDTLWSAIPNVLAHMVRTVHKIQMDPDLVDNPNQSVTTHVIYYKKGVDGKEEKVTLEIGLSELFGTNGNDGLLKTGGNSDTSVVDDPSMLELLNLVFHGTNEDIHRNHNVPEGAENDDMLGVSSDTASQKGTAPIMQLTDAYYKNGFYINPDVARQGGNGRQLEISKVSNKVNGGEVTFFYEIDTPYELFTSNVDVRNSGMELSLFELMKLSQPTNQAPPSSTQSGTPPSTTTTSNGQQGGGTTTTGNGQQGGNTTTLTREEQFRRDEPDFAKFLDKYGSNYEYSVAGVMECVRNLNNSAHDAIIKAILGNVHPKVIAKMIHDYKVSGGKVYIETVEDFCRKHGEVRINDDGIWVKFDQRYGPDGGRVFKFSSYNNFNVLFNDDNNPFTTAVNTNNDNNNGTTNEPSKLSTRLDDKNGQGMTYGEMLVNLFGGNLDKQTEFTKKCLDEGVDENVLKNFRTAIMNIIQTNEDVKTTDGVKFLDNMIDALVSNESYNEITGQMLIDHEDLYEALFMKCD